MQQHGPVGVVEYKGVVVWGKPALALFSIGMFAMLLGMAYALGVGSMCNRPQNGMIAVPTREEGFTRRKRGKRRGKKSRSQHNDDIESVADDDESVVESAVENDVEAPPAPAVLPQADSDQATLPGSRQAWKLLVECEHRAGLLLSTQKILKDQRCEMDNVTTSTFVRGSDVWIRMGCTVLMRGDRDCSHTQRLVREYLGTALSSENFNLQFERQPDVFVG